jgi:hypothetical protein
MRWGARVKSSAPLLPKGAMLLCGTLPDMVTDWQPRRTTIRCDNSRRPLGADCSQRGKKIVVDSVFVARRCN